MFCLAGPSSGVEIDQKPSQDEGRQHDQPCLRAKRTTRPDFGPVNPDSGQGINIETRNGEAKYDTLKEIPPDVQPDGKPELFCADVPIGQIDSGKENSSRTDPGRVGVTQMKETKHSRGDDYTPKQVQSACNGLQMIASRKKFFVPTNEYKHHQE